VIRLTVALVIVIVVATTVAAVRFLACRAPDADDGTDDPAPDVADLWR
jgi:hypothetical protein